MTIPGSAPGMPPAPGAQEVAAGTDAMVPSPARMYDYLIGGKDNLAVDRAAAQELMSAFPGVRRVALANRGFLVRALWFLAAPGIASTSTWEPAAPRHRTCTR